MTSIFLDTNNWLRLFLKDQESQYQDISSLIKLIDDSQIRPYTSSIVFLEVNYVLTSFYGLNKKATLIYLQKIRDVKNITILEKEDLEKALKLYRQFGIKFADCLIATQIPKGIPLITFDREFRKIKDIDSLTPAEFLKSLKSN